MAWLVITPLCFAAGLWISAPRRRARFTRSSGSRVRDALGVAVRALVLMRALPHAPARLALRAVGGAALFWAGELLCAWAALRSFGVTVAVAPLLLGYTTGYVSLGLPLPAGGSGSVDAAMTGGFVLAGASLSSCAPRGDRFRLFSFWLPALLALLSLATLRGLKARLRAIAEGAGRSRGDAQSSTAMAQSRPGRIRNIADLESVAQLSRADGRHQERHRNRDRAVDEHAPGSRGSAARRRARGRPPAHPRSFPVAGSPSRSGRACTRGPRSQGRARPTPARRGRPRARSDQRRCSRARPTASHGSRPCRRSPPAREGFADEAEPAPPRRSKGPGERGHERERDHRRHDRRRE